MKKLIVSIALLCSWNLMAIAIPRTCEDFYRGHHADYLIKGRVLSISSEIKYWSDEETSYDVLYSADFEISEVLKGSGVVAGQTIKISYKDVVPVGEDRLIPGFQGHDPIPQEGEEWAVFLRNGFEVAPPNGWWNEDSCW